MAITKTMRGASGVVAFAILATITIPASIQDANAEPAYIYAVHDPGGEWMMGNNKGWIVWTEAIGTSGSGGNNYSSYQNAGYGVIVRLNNGYGSSGTIPYESQYDAFAARCANFIQNSSGVDYWIIGNETNLPREWPGNNHGDPTTGEPITVARYVSCYNKCYTAIKNVAPNAKICPSPVGTWAPPYWAQGIGEFDDYWVDELNAIGANKVDGLILHAYTHGCDPALVTSEQKMGPPYEHIYYHFRVYKNLMNVIPTAFQDKPVLITECDQNVECADNASPKHAWYNVNNGWMKAVYAEINDWNQNNTHQIRCVAMFRWPLAQEGEYTYGLETLYNCQQDFQEAVAYGYTWNSGPPPPCDSGPGTPSGSNLSLTAPYYLASGKNDSDQYGEAALDGDTSTKWCCNMNDSGGTATLTVDLGSTASVTGFVLRHAETGGEISGYNTQYFRVESGSSMFGPWTTQWNEDNNCQSSYNTFQFSSAVAMRYVRLVITDAGSDSYVRLPEFEIYGATSGRTAITIEAEDFEGGANAANGTDYYDTSSGNSGGAYRTTDVDIESSTDGRYNVGWIAANEWLNYPVRGDGDDYDVTLRYACPYGQGSCHLELDGVDVTGTLTFSNTGSWQGWATLDCGTITIPAGWHTLTFVVDGAGINIASYTLDPDGGVTPPPVPTMTETVPTGTNVATSASWWTDSDYNSSFTGAKAIDGLLNSGDKWVSNGSTSTHWLVLDLGSTQTVNGYKVHHAGAYEAQHYNTQAFELQGGTSSSGPWTTHATVDNSDQADNVTNLSYDTAQELRYVRLYITDAGIDNYVRLPEFEVYAQVSSGNQTPVAVASASPTSGDAPLAVSVNGSGSSDGDGDTLSYTWNWGDGTSNGSGVTASHTYSTAGTYTLTLTVNDGNGGLDTDTVTITANSSGLTTTVSENFSSMPSWSSSFDASWGSAASWSISGGALQAARSSQGSSAKVMVYTIDPNTDYRISIFIRCPSSSNSYWAECAYRLGSYTANNFDDSGSSWTMVKKFDNGGTNGNGNSWTEYYLDFNSGSNTQISVGYKLGSSGGGAPTVQWDDLSID